MAKSGGKQTQNIAGTKIQEKNTRCKMNNYFKKKILKIVFIPTYYLNVSTQYLGHHHERRKNEHN